MTRIEKIESYKTELTDILNVMDIPSERKNLIVHNLRWLSRNVGIRNSEHQSFHRSIALIKLLLQLMNEDK